MTFSLRLHLGAWLLRADRYGVALTDVEGFAQSLAETDLDDAHDCERDHPDAGCDQGYAFTEDDLHELLWRARNGDHPDELMAEFVAAIRAEPKES